MGLTEGIKFGNIKKLDLSSCVDSRNYESILFTRKIMLEIMFKVFEKLQNWEEFFTKQVIHNSLDFENHW